MTRLTNSEQHKKMANSGEVILITGNCTEYTTNMDADDMRMFWIGSAKYVYIYVCIVEDRVCVWVLYVLACV